MPSTAFNALSSDDTNDAESTYEIIDNTFETNLLLNEEQAVGVQLIDTQKSPQKSTKGSEVGSQEHTVLERLMKEIRKNKEEIDRMMKQEKTLSTLVELLKEKLAKKETSNTDEVSRLNGQLRVVEGEKASLNDRIEAEREMLRTIKTEIEVMKKTIEEKEKKCEANASLAENLIDENRKLKEKIEQMKDHKKTNLSLVHLLKEKIEKEETSKKAEEIASLNEMVRMAELDKETLTGRIHHERELVNTLETENILLKEANETYQRKCEDITTKAEVARLNRNARVPRNDEINRDDAIHTVTLARAANGKFGFTYSGTLIFWVQDGTPAHINGIRPGDQLVSVGGVQVETLSRADVEEVLKEVKGDRIELVLRYNPERLKDLETMAYRVVGSWAIALIAIFIVWMFL